MQKFNVRTLYIYKFISECLPIYAFYTILFIGRGKTLSEVAVLIALWSVFTIAFEIPSGILADRANRRNMLAAASVLQGICFVVWFFSHSFFMFALGFVFWGIAGAFQSGTEESLIFDNLKADGIQEKFAAVYGRAEFFASIGAIVGIASAGLLATLIGIPAIALISAAICVINAGVALRLREKNLYAETSEETSGELNPDLRECSPLKKSLQNWVRPLGEAVGFLKGSKFAVVCILFLVLFAGMGNYLDEFDALIVDSWGIGELWVSAVLSVRFAFVALGRVLAERLEGRISLYTRKQHPASRECVPAKTCPRFSLHAVCVLCVTANVALLGFAVIWSHFAILFFGIAFMLMAAAEVLLVTALQNEIKEESRATIMSFYGVGQDVFMVCFALVFAVLAGIFTMQAIYIILAVYGIIGGLVLSLWNAARSAE